LFDKSKVGGLRDISYADEGSVTWDIQDAELQELQVKMRDLQCAFRALGFEIFHVKDDLYSINDRCIQLLLLPMGFPTPSCAHLSNVLDVRSQQLAAGVIVQDGPLQQPLFDYLLHTGINENYDARGTENPWGVTGRARTHTFYAPQTNDRIDAMTIATAQSAIRRQVERKTAHSPEAYRSAVRKPSLGPGPSRYGNKAKQTAATGGA
jgi:hypothetical protein